jgi:flagellar export protein FliJ
MKPRAAWPVLAKKAKEKCDEALAELQKSKERVTHLLQSKARMLQLYEDYVQRCKRVESEPDSMAQILNLRNFMQQVQALIARVEIDLQQAHADVDAKRMLLKAAEQKRIQMETLVEQDLKAVREYHRKREQKEMDAAGVMLYNLKH